MQRRPRMNQTAFENPSKKKEIIGREFHYIELNLVLDRKHLSRPEHGYMPLYSSL